MTDNRCDLCGKFKKIDDLKSMGGEDNEVWNECVDCMSQSDLEEHLGKGKHEK